MLRVRIYFNRFADAPLIWSWDQGTQATEERVSGFELHGIAAVSGCDPAVPAGDKNSPKIWVELLDVIWQETRDGVAHFYGVGR